MHGNSSAIIPFIVFLFVLLAIDLYAWKGISSALINATESVKRYARFSYWGVSIAIYFTGAVVIFVVFVLGRRDGFSYPVSFGMAGILLMFLLPKLLLVIFHLVEDIHWLLSWTWQQLIPNKQSVTGEAVDRAHFLSQLGLIVSAIPFTGILYGMTIGRSDLQVEEIDIRSSKIPKAFDGFRIVQLSDMHLGSLTNDNELVSKGVSLIKEVAPDLLLFTGDMVNDVAAEVEPWIDQLSAITAPFGKFSVLGNHDYSDYKRWSSQTDKEANFRTLLQHQSTMGFDVLMDEYRTIERNGESITLVGVQNFGGRGFQQYGDLKKALRGADPNQFKILMSHDPSHWDLEIKDTDVDLTLSGHTHGMQMGVKIADKRFSPVSMIYKHWAGLYTEAEQMLYVNRGFGYIGFPGRVGMPPEITVLTLRSDA
jgi:predicted MPP superfamily phosphohydrolase